MSETAKIFLTSGLTLIGGIIIYVIGRTIEKFILDPIHEQKKTIGLISSNLIFHADVYSNPSVSSLDEKKHASKALRNLASDLDAKTRAIPFYHTLSSFDMVLDYNSAIEGGAALIGLSNALYRNDIDVILNKRDRVETLLKIKRPS